MNGTYLDSGGVSVDSTDTSGDQLQTLFQVINDHPVVSILVGALVFTAIFGLPKQMNFGGSDRQSRTPSGGLFG